MATPQELRQRRLRNDYGEMLNIKGPVIDWEPLRGTPPLVEQYALHIRLHTIVGPPPQYRDEHELLLTLQPDYPASAPLVVMQTRPGPFHPNWFGGGRWCHGKWTLEGLGHFVVRMMRTLQFDPEITNTHSIALQEAERWYVANRGRGLFPCDRTALPDPTRARLRILSTGPAKTFRIE